MATAAKNSIAISELTPSPRHESQCRYKGSICPQLRTVKDDGELHRFCEMHRSIAIRNQQRWQQRRRAKQQQQALVIRPPLGHYKTSDFDVLMDPLDTISDADWVTLALLLVDTPAQTPPPTASTDSLTTLSPIGRKTQRHKRRTQQTARLMTPYFYKI